MPELRWRSSSCSVCDMEAGQSHRLDKPQDCQDALFCVEAILSLRSLNESDKDCFGTNSNVGVRSSISDIKLLGASPSVCGGGVSNICSISGSISDVALLRSLDSSLGCECNSECSCGSGFAIGLICLPGHRTNPSSERDTSDQSSFEACGAV